MQDDHLDARILLGRRQQDRRHDGEQDAPASFPQHRRGRSWPATAWRSAAAGCVLKLSVSPSSRVLLVNAGRAARARWPTKARLEGGVERTRAGDARSAARPRSRGPGAGSSRTRCRRGTPPRAGRASPGSAVKRCSIHSACITPHSSSRVNASSAPNGSSSISSSGSWINARHRFERCCMPPESCHGNRRAKSVRPTVRSSFMARAFELGAMAERNRRLCGSTTSSGSRMLSMVVRQGIKRGVLERHADALAPACPRPTFRPCTTHHRP